ncbi:MAG: glycosyltransferase [Candidatus Krumholzibacteriia bacterium]
MKICDIVQSFTARSGGIRTYIRAKQAFLRDRGRHEHVLIMPGERDRTTVRDGGTVHEVRSPFVPGYRPYRFNLRIDKVVRLLAAERPELIELASPYLMPWAAFAHRRRHPCAVVGYYHADFPEAYVAAPVASVWGDTAGAAARRAAEAYARTIYRRCDLTVTASPTYRRRLQAMGVGPVREVPLGVDLAVFHPGRRDPEVWPRFFPDAPPGPVMIYSGRLDREKQVEVLVEAFHRLPPELNARLFMLGEGPLRPALTAIAAGDPRLCVQPYEPDRVRLATLLASAQLYVTAGPFETFGLSVIEAQASGLPIVGVAAGALPDRVPRGLGALTPVGDAAAMAAAMVDQLACDPLARGLAARAWVEREFGWARVFDELCGLYESLPRRRRGVILGHRGLAAMGVGER